MKFQILHRGVPIGHADLAVSELAVGEFVPNAGYVGIRDLILDASKSLWAMGFLSETPTQSPVMLHALSSAAMLKLELRDSVGALVPVDFVNIVERPDPKDPPVVFARFRLSGSPDPSIVHSGPSSDTERR